jgi:hypothetical protein
VLVTHGDRFPSPPDCPSTSARTTCCMRTYPSAGNQTRGWAPGSSTRIKDVSQKLGRRDVRLGRRRRNIDPFLRPEQADRGLQAYW